MYLKYNNRKLIRKNLEFDRYNVIRDFVDVKSDLGTMSLSK